jgi:signal peptidase I
MTMQPPSSSEPAPSAGGDDSHNVVASAGDGSTATAYPYVNGAERVEGTIATFASAPVELATSRPWVEAWDAYALRTGAAASQRRRASTLRTAREIVETGILALVIFLGVRMVVQNFRVEGLSMDPTYRTGQYLLVNKAVFARFDPKELAGLLPFVNGEGEARYLLHGPERGDVIVFVPPLPNRGDRDFIKRVIGVPGDRVSVRDGRVFVNGQLALENYIPGVQTFCGGQWCDVNLGPDQYYVMGDNRGNSSDSRLWGPVPADHIVGKAWLIYLPFSDFGPAPYGPPAFAAGDGAATP